VEPRLKNTGVVVLRSSAVAVEFTLIIFIMQNIAAIEKDKSTEN